MANHSSTAITLSVLGIVFQVGSQAIGRFGGDAAGLIVLPMILVGTILLAVAGWLIAGEKGYPNWVGAVLGLFCIPGMAVLLFLPDR